MMGYMMPVMFHGDQPLLKPSGLTVYILTNTLLYDRFSSGG